MSSCVCLQFTFAFSVPVDARLKKVLGKYIQNNWNSWRTRVANNHGISHIIVILLGNDNGMAFHLNSAGCFFKECVDILSHLMFDYSGENCCRFKIESGSVSCSAVLTLCNPVDCSLSDSSVHGILQARILNGLPFPFSRGSSQPRYQSQVSYIEVSFFTIWPTRETHKIRLK